MDIKKVKKGLECCAEYDCKQEECPYWGKTGCDLTLHKEALELIEQMQKDCDYYLGFHVLLPAHGDSVFKCGRCGAVLTEGIEHCTHCGQAVKWEE